MVGQFPNNIMDVFPNGSDNLLLLLIDTILRRVLSVKRWWSLASWYKKSFTFYVQVLTFTFQNLEIQLNASNFEFQNCRKVSFFFLIKYFLNPQLFNSKIPKEWWENWSTSKFQNEYDEKEIMFVKTNLLKMVRASQIFIKNKYKEKFTKIVLKNDN